LLWGVRDWGYGVGVISISTNLQSGHRVDQSHEKSQFQDCFQEHARQLVQNQRLSVATGFSNHVVAFHGVIKAVVLQPKNQNHSSLSSANLIL
jgi:hypothetical protein